MEIYCSSPNCRNECGRRHDPLDAWKDPDSIKGFLIMYKPFCDTDGNKIKFINTEKQPNDY